MHKSPEMSAYGMYYFQRPEARLDKCNKTVNIKVALHFLVSV